MTIPISVLILTYNEELNIEKCLRSVHGWADEIFIVDSYSTDKTLEIAKEYTDKICQHAFETQARQIKWSQDSLPVSNEWILRLDADERLPKEIKEEIEAVLPKLDKDISGIYLNLRVHFMGRWIRYGGHYPFLLLRLWRKEHGSIEDRFMDERIIVNGKTITLQHDFIEDDRKDLTIWINKQNNYSSREVKQLLFHNSEGKQISVKASLFGNKIQRKRWLKDDMYAMLPIFLRAFLYFIYRYFFRLGFLDGKEGLIFHFLQGFWYRFLVDAKIYEYKRLKKLD